MNRTEIVGGGNGLELLRVIRVFKLVRRYVHFGGVYFEIVSRLRVVNRFQMGTVSQLRKVLPAAMAVTHRGDSGDHHAPHRGGVVMAAGIIGLVFILFELVGYSYVGPFAAPLTLVGLVLSIAAWVMGGSDLDQMSAGTMDRSGRRMTMGGYVCGSIGTILRIIEIGCVGIVLILIVLALDGLPMIGI